jgi:dTMP kinase
MNEERGKYRGFIAHFDGPDGGGKGTQIDLAENYLSRKGYSIIRARDPGGTIIGEEIRRVLLHFDANEMAPTTEVFLFMASRAQLIRQIIRPALEQGRIVLLDRFVDATRAYQGAAGRVSPEYIEQCARLATEGLTPDRSYFTDVPVEVGISRVGKDPDRIERKTLDYHRAVRQGFLEIAAREPGRIMVVDGTQDPKAIHQQIIADLERCIQQHEQKYKLLRTNQD